METAEENSIDTLISLSKELESLQKVHEENQQKASIEQTKVQIQRLRRRLEAEKEVASIAKKLSEDMKKQGLVSGEDYVTFQVKARGGKRTVVCVRSPNMESYSYLIRWENSKEIEQFTNARWEPVVTPCLVHPTIEDFRKLVDESPDALSSTILLIRTMARQVTEQVKKQ